MSKFRDRSQQVAEALHAGLTVEAAAERADVAATAVRSWLRKGEREPQSAHGRWLASIDGAKVLDRVDEPMSVEGAKRCLERAVRKGSIGALRLWFERHDREPAAADDPFAEFDARPS